VHDRVEAAFVFVVSELGVGNVGNVERCGALAFGDRQHIVLRDIQELGIGGRRTA
jgi:hypothetical protein